MDDELRRKAKLKNDREYLPAQLKETVRLIEFWQSRQKERWAEKDTKRAEICGQMITIYQLEAKDINRKIKSWL